MLRAQAPLTAKAPARDIAGYYGDSSAVYHGFVRAASGAITTFDAPGAGTVNQQGTVAYSINTAGAVAGYYYDANLAAHGLLRETSGAITTFDAPGAAPGSNRGTFAYGIDAAGTIAGNAL